MATAQNELQMSSTAYRTTAAPYDILANDPLKLNVPGLATPSEGRPCRWIVANAAGTFTVIGLDGVAVVLTALQGQRFDLQATSISVLAISVTVYW
jgi:hypothetical protein